MSKTVSSLVILIGMTVGVNAGQNLAFELSENEYYKGRENLRSSSHLKRTYLKDFAKEEELEADRSIENALSNVSDEEINELEPEDVYQSDVENFNPDQLNSEGFEQGLDLTAFIE